MAWQAPPDPSAEPNGSVGAKGEESLIDRPAPGSHSPSVFRHTPKSATASRGISTVARGLDNGARDQNLLTAADPE